jgi:hypothetical protein
MLWWAIDSAAVNPLALMFNRNSCSYRRPLDTNLLAERIQLTSGIGQAYTATVIGPDGVVYAVNNAVLFSVGQ